MRPHPCPACGLVPALQALLPWGEGRQALPIAPWLCLACGALALIDLATGVLWPTTDAMWQVVQERNPALWQAIVAARARAGLRRTRSTAPPDTGTAR